jgi:GT2 family glycosyltransferase
MRSPMVSIIIPTHNGRAHLEECFRSLRALNYPSDRREIILVDNGSSDGSVEYVRQSYPEATVVRNEKNEGFAGPCNSAAERSQSEYLAFLNNDTRVHPEWLNELTRSIESPTIDTEMVACVAGKIVSWDGRTLEYDGGILNFHGHGHHLGMGQPISAGSSHNQLTIFACAASMLIRRDVFLEVGGFDQDYFAYFEDVDLGWRLWLFGFQVLYCPTAIVFHKGHGTAALSQAERKKLLERNGLFNVFKNYSDANLEQVLLPALSLSAMKASIDPEYCTSYLEAINEFFTCLDQFRFKRHDIQRRRKLDDEHIFPLFRQPFRPSMHDANYWSLQRKLVRSFKLDKMFYKEGGPMKEQLVGYENLIEDLYRLQRETADAHGLQLTEARQEAETLHARVREVEALLQARDGQLAEARQEGETLRARAGVLEEQNQLQERLIQASMHRLDDFLSQQSRRLSTRIIDFLFWSRGPRP